ncbi:MAG: hypothetical protein RIQ48_696 [Pseudomonadota bacterium]|jgi:hypothetical protein
MKIFVQIASYRDPQLITTIEDLLNKADNPDLFTFGICWQYDETEDINKYDGNPKFKISKHHYSESQGLGWARSITNSLYTGEDLVLQLDSHHRFLKSWDVLLLEDFNQARSMSCKPVLTTYLTPFEPEEAQFKEIPCIMTQYEFSDENLLMNRPFYIQDYKSRFQVIRSRTISGHFFLTLGSFLSEIPYDPDIYFGGYVEETSLSVRAFTHGYDFYSPYRQYIWHEYTREGRPKHWEDHTTSSLTGEVSGNRDILAKKKVRQLFEQENHNINIGKYGLGNIRSLHDYEIYAGIDFKKCRIQDYTLSAKEPPNPNDWEGNFISKNFKFECEWDLDFFKKYNFKNPKTLTFGIHDNRGIEIFRKDFVIENPEDVDYVNLIKNKYNVNIYSETWPRKIVMYLLNQDDTWSDRYEGRANAYIISEK